MCYIFHPQCVSFAHFASSRLMSCAQTRDNTWCVQTYGSKHAHHYKSRISVLHDGLLPGARKFKSLNILRWIRCNRVHRRADSRCIGSIGSCKAACENICRIWLTSSRQHSVASWKVPNSRKPSVPHIATNPQTGPLGGGGIVAAQNRVTSGNNLVTSHYCACVELFKN